MATISTIASEVATDMLFRTDLTSQIQNYMRDAYRVIASKVPLEELQANGVLTTIIGTRIYDLNTAPITDLAGIVSIQIAYSATQVQRLTRTHIRILDQQPVPANGKPFRYARWGTGIVVDPPPDTATYTLNIRYWKKATIDGTVGNTTLLIPDAWLELLKWETFYRVLMAINRHQEAMNLIMPNPQPKMPSPSKVMQREIGIIPRLWNELLLTIQERENIDEDFGLVPTTVR